MRTIVLSLLLLASPAPADDDVLPWYVDDYAGALADAKKSDRPLVMDLWAPWCHTCLSMKSTVLANPALSMVAERFVWLALDTDKAANFEALAKFPPKLWPTFYVINPEGVIQAQLQGGATIEAFLAFLDRGFAGAQEGRSEDAALVAGSPEFQLREGDRAVTESRWADAEAAYERALAMAPAQWDAQARVRLTRLSTRYRQRDWKACFDLASRDLERAFLGHTPAAADFVYYLHACAKHVENGPRRRGVLQRGLASLYGLFADAHAPLTLDDRSEALRIAREIHMELGQRPQARGLAETQRLLLEEGVRIAKSPKEAMTFSWPRAEVYVWLGRGADLVPHLAVLAEALPDEYDPLYRLAWVRHTIGQSTEAVETITAAEALAYGPRKARVLALSAKIHAAAGDAKGALAARQAVVTLLEGLPEARRPPGALEAARKALAAG